ncbi:MAG: pentapeptide repeat-containing protein [Synechococcus sp.]
MGNFNTNGLQWNCGLPLWKMPSFEIGTVELLQRYASGSRDFTGVKLSTVYLSQASLVGINLYEADFFEVAAIEADLSRANLSGANLSRANLRRVKLIARDGTIEKLFYPVFPPSNNADEVLIWLQSYA